MDEELEVYLIFIISVFVGMYLQGFFSALIKDLKDWREKNKK